MGALVRAILGPPGSGKTYLMSAMAQDWRKAHPWKPIFSTYELRVNGVYALDPPGDTWAPTKSILEAADGLMLIDEAALLFDSRLFGKTPVDLLHRLMQLRKVGLELWWSTQYLEYVDKRLRLLTMESYHCHNFNFPFSPWAGFFYWIREGVKGKPIGFKYLARSGKRDKLYDSWRLVGRAEYYQSKSGNGKRGADESAAVTFPANAGRDGGARRERN